MNIETGMYLRTVARFALEGASDIVNVYNHILDADGGATADDIADTALNMIESFMAILEVGYATVLSLEEVLVYGKPPTGVGKWIPLGARTSAWTGLTDTPQTLPPGVAPLVTMAASDGLRGARKYLPPVHEGAVENGIVLPVHAGRMLAFAALAAMSYLSGGITMSPVVWRTVTGAAIRLTGDVGVKTVLAYQRRRKPNVGS